MSKLESTKRQLLIIKKLRRSVHASFVEISDYLSVESEIDGYYNYVISKRTLNRDIAEIGELYGIYIKYDFSGRYYFIEEEFDAELSNRMFESLEVYNALRVKERLSSWIELDRRCVGGTEYLYRILRAIRDHSRIEIEYSKYYRSAVSHRVVDPLLLREFRHRWYIYARDTYDATIKCYALDRMRSLLISVDHFAEPDPAWRECFRYCFGVMLPDASMLPCEVILSFTYLQGCYIKSLPLHETQEVILDTADELRIRLTVYLTHDFVMELLSYGDSVKVISPESLSLELQEQYESALGQY
ncbi:MAG: WYL domain-containing protein [Prevotellaceae bacterium]|jgi:predicted DNA-binding transcriptional regulator YafY|nr:WYL domain-containing protein [Prevotellaceae bacterium]